MHPRFPSAARSALLAGLLLAGGCHRVAEQPAVSHAWVRLAAVPGQPAAAYFALGGGRHDAKLIKVESALAKQAELHASMVGAGGMMTMAPLKGVDVLARQKVIFAPGGYHVMLIGLDPVVKAGTAVPLRFGFADGHTAEAEAKTVSAGDPIPY